MTTDRTTRTSYWLMVLALALRLSAIASTPAIATLMHLAGAAWVAPLALYLWQFTPVLIRPRNQCAARFTIPSGFTMRLAAAPIDNNVVATN